MTQPSLFDDYFDRSKWISGNTGLLAQCFDWLQACKLTREVLSHQPNLGPDNSSPLTKGWRVQPGIPVNRAQHLTSSELKAATEEYRKSHEGKQVQSPEALQAMWDEYQKISASIQLIDLDRVCADALAFYRPFHFLPQDEWGIYIMVEPMLRDCLDLLDRFGDKLCFFTPQTLLWMRLFEVFNHEFFHHLVEATATTIEVVISGLREPVPVYVPYFSNCHELVIGKHQDAPLEEALANAYAYNSLSFLSRVKTGYKPIQVDAYQKVLAKSWLSEPPGYRYAENYIRGEHVLGGGQLLSMLMPNLDQSTSALMLVARNVMPGGHAALTQKPEIPTYLVGSQEALKFFYELVPVPHETYTELYWIEDTTSIDAYIMKQQEAAKENKRKAKAGRKG